MNLIPNYKNKIKSEKFKISFSFESIDPYFYLEPLLFLSDEYSQIRSAEDAVGSDFRISTCQGVIFNRQKNTFLLDLNRLDTDIKCITLVLSPPPNYQFRTLTDYFVDIESLDTPSEKFYAPSCCNGSDKLSDFVMVFKFVRYARHSGWYVEGLSRYFCGDSDYLYRLFGCKDYFPYPIYNLNMV